MSEQPTPLENEPYGHEIGERVYVRIWKGNKREILVVLNKRGPLPNGDMRDTGWGLPGGGKKPNEAAREAGLREVKEEVGEEMALAIEPTLRHIKSIKRWTRDRGGKTIVGGDYITHHLYEADIEDGVKTTGGVDPVGIVTEARWVDPFDIREGFVESETYSENGKTKFRIYQSHIRLIESRE